MLPTDRLYTKSHEWVLIEGDVATVGLTDFAQHALGDIVFVELPEEGAAIDAGGQIAVVESVKAASEVYSGVAGEVTQRNEALEDAPEQINEAPWEAWIAKLRISEPAEGLLDAAAYAELVAAEEAKA